jgi:alkylation response protein AidB-like acyl-CoA dehydrogenase
MDERLWQTLAGANLLGLAISEEYGGSGLGFVEVCLLLEECGRAAAAVPLLPSVVLAGMTIGQFGDEEQRAQWLPALAEGRLVATAALVEAGADPAAPATSARPGGGGGWVLDGMKTCVPAGTIAGLILVPARLPGGETAVFALEPTASGLAMTALETTTGVPEAHLDLTEVEVPASARLGGSSSGDVLHWTLQRATVGLCALMSGTCQEAVRLTGEYVRTREQFGHPLATFQAVGQRAADAYVDTEAVRLTALQAAWRLATGRPSEAEVAIAKFWAADGGQRVVHAAVHLHGGVGVDRSYPLHHYFLAAKQLELSLGGATPSLLRLGALMAEEPA